MVLGSNSRHGHLDRSLHNLLYDSLSHFPLSLKRFKPVQDTHYSDSKALLWQIMAPLWHHLQKRSSSLRLNRLASHAPRLLHFSQQISSYYFSCFRLLNFLCLVTNRHLQAIPSLASIAAPGIMGTVAGLSAAPSYVTPAKHARGTTLATIAFTAQ